MKTALLVLCLVLFMPAAAHGTAVEEILREQLQRAPLGELSRRHAQLRSPRLEALAPGFDPAGTARSLALGDWSWDPKALFERAVRFFFAEAQAQAGLFATLLALALLGALAENLARGFGREGAAEPAFYTCFLLIASTAVTVFLNGVNLAAETIDNMVVFVSTLLPTTLSLLAAGGAVATAGILHPVLTLCVQMISLIVRNIVFPLTLLSAALSMGASMQEQGGIGPLADVLRGAAKWILGLTLTVFVGVVGVLGLAAPAMDGLTLKTAKFAVGSAVPVVGSLLSESVDLVLGCSVVLKNAVGISGMLAVAAICAVPLLTLGAQAALLKLSSAAIAPVSDPRVVKVISLCADSLLMVFASVAVTALMFLINLAVILGAGNTAAAIGG